MATAHFDPGGWLRTLWEIQWFAGIIPALFAAGALAVACREGNWPRRKTLLYAAPIAAWAAVFIAAQALAMWAVHQRPPAIVLTAEGIWCAPWPEATRWEDIASLGSHDEKVGYGWKTLGVTLNTTRPATLRLQPASFDSKLLHWGVRLAHGPVFGHASDELPCGTLGLDRDSQILRRLIQEIHFKLGPRVDFKSRPRNGCWVAHCLSTKGLDYICVANMPSDPSVCAGSEPRGPAPRATALAPLQSSPPD